MSTKPLLAVNNLTVEFGSAQQPFRAVDRLSLSVDAGQMLAIVGESGSGKSVAMMSLMGLVGAPARVSADSLMFDGQDLQKLTPKERRAIIGRDVSMVFQDAMTSLNPSFTVESQITEVLKVHMGLRGADARARVLQLLDQVEIPDAKNRMTSYPHQLSGGMSQRVMIAMAMACEPKLLIADEPTTALDVTIQAQIMNLLMRLQRDENMALILITHDLALVSQSARDVAVMYAGQVVELNQTPYVFQTPSHPYTEALLAAIPENSVGAKRLKSLSGVVPNQYDRPAGCLLSPRCPYVQEGCHQPVDLQPMAHGMVRCIAPRHSTTQTMEG